MTVCRGADAAAKYPVQSISIRGILSLVLLLFVLLAFTGACDDPPVASPAPAASPAPLASAPVEADTPPSAPPAPADTEVPLRAPSPTPLPPTAIPPPTPTPRESIAIWAPAYLGARVFFEGDIAEALRSELDLDLTLTEEDISYSELQARVEAGLRDGSLAGDILLLPGTVAGRLETGGLVPILNLPVLAAEAGDIPNPLALALVLVDSRDADGANQQARLNSAPGCLSTSVDSEIRSAPGCLERPTTTLLSYRPPRPSDHRRPIEFNDALEAEKVVRDTFDAAQKTFEDMLAEDGVKLAADWIFRKTGWLSLRFVLRGLVIYGTVDSAKSFYELAEETGGLLEAWTDLDKANYRGGTQAVDEIDDLTKRAVDMIAELAECSLTVTDASAELEELRRRVRQQVDEVNRSAGGLADNGNSEAANSLREWADNLDASFAEIELELSLAILAKQERTNDEIRVNNQSPRIKSFTNLLVQEDHMNDYEVEAEDPDGHELFYRWMLLNLTCGEARGTGVQPHFGYWHEPCDFPDEAAAWVVVFVYDCFGGLDWYGQPARDDDHGVPITDRRQMIDNRGENRPDSVSDTLQEIGTELEGDPCL